MKIQNRTINCPNCGAPISIDNKTCEYCDGPIIISTFNSVREMTIPLLKKHINSYNDILQNDESNSDVNLSIAMCYLKLRIYDKAIYYFEKAIEDCFDNSEIYFYLAIALLRGKKAFLTPRKEIDKAIEYLYAAVEIENRGIYFYFISYIVYDHHFRKGYYIDPNYKYFFNIARQNGVSQNDVKELFGILNLEIPLDIRI